MLEAHIRAPTTEQREVFRARIILLAAEGGSTRSIARALDTMPRTVSAWRGRFTREGLAGLNNKPHPWPAPKYGVETGRPILALLDEPPPKGYARWTGSTTELGEGTFGLIVAAAVEERAWASLARRCGGVRRSTVRNWAIAALTECG